MTYAFDNSPLSVLFKNYYRRRFPSLWQRFDDLVADGAVESLRDWAAQNVELFTIPTAAEGRFVARIYAVQHFQQNIELQKLLKGGRNADPFIIAKAAVGECTVVTMEQFRPNGVKIPNICHHFGIPCMTLEHFMESEGWEF
jgi:hypothetical protein